jgi:hypothetical protein
VWSEVAAEYSFGAGGGLGMGNWIDISDELPKQNEEVLFCCDIDGEFTSVSLGWYTGHKTLGRAIVMETIRDDDWSPCTHWMALPKTPGPKYNPVMECKPVPQVK